MHETSNTEAAVLWAPASPAPSSPPIPGRRWGTWSVRLGIAGLLSGLIGQIGYITLTNNLHTVIEGQLYRGAQPSPRSLEAIINQYHIRTVINVRGCGYPNDWYIQEAAVCQQHGVHLEDVSLSAIHLPSRHELTQLVAALDHAARPVYLHCRQGADRTGLAAMIALLLREEVSYREARRQLGIFYGHMPIGKTTVLDRFFSLYEDWLARAGQAHSPARFRHWLSSEYRGGWCDAQFVAVERLFETARLGQPLSYRVEVRNTSPVPWEFRTLKAAGHHVAFKVLDANEQTVCEDRAGMLDQAVQPGETIRVTLVVPPILKKGSYRLVVDMIEEGHCWFHQSGSELWEEELVIRE